MFQMHSATREQWSGNGTTKALKLSYPTLSFGYSLGLVFRPVVKIKKRELDQFRKEKDHINEKNKINKLCSDTSPQVGKCILSILNLDMK